MKANDRMSTESQVLEKDAEILTRVIEATKHSLDDVERMAKHAGKSGLAGFTEDQAFILMMICQAENRHPIEAIRRYHIIPGNEKRPPSISLRAEVALAEMLGRGWRVEWESDADNGQIQTALFWHQQRCPEGKRVKFAIDEARRAGLVKDWSNWTRWPAEMLRARVVTRAARMLDPAVIAGMIADEEAEDVNAAAIQSAARPAVERLAEKLHQKVAATQTPIPDPAPLIAPTAPSGAMPFEAKSPDPPTEPDRRGEEWRAWIDKEVNEACNEIASAMLDQGASKVDASLIKPQQVYNHLLSDAIKAGRLLAETIQNSKGKRDPELCRAMVAQMWALNPEAVQDEVHGYLAEKISDAVTKGGAK